LTLLGHKNAVLDAKSTKNRASAGFLEALQGDFEAQLIAKPSQVG